ncbi:MAG: acetylornithine deacetylase [Chlamydiales bacterium]|jgi:acetylornithine deacetylase
MTLLTDLNLLERLVAFDTTSCKSNLELAQFVADYLDRPGVCIERNPSPDGSKTNLVVRVGPDPGGERDGLVLSGHMDVVPALERGWDSDPFRLTEREDNLVARGSSDMKGFLAISINALARLKVEDLRNPLALLFTYDEEVGTLGSRHFVDTWPAADLLPRRTIVGEPTSLTLLRSHKGHLTYRLRFRGKAAHSGFPMLGVNALEPMARAILALTELDRQMRSERPEYSDFFPSVPFVPLNVGVVRGGVAVNVIPDSGDVEFGVRHLPGMQTEEIEQRIRGALDGSLAGAEYDLGLERESPPMMAPVGCEFHRTLTEVTGCQEGEGASFATDAGWFQTRGHECVLLGPGSIEVAHRPNEFVPRADLVRGAEMIELLVRRYCL